MTINSISLNKSTPQITSSMISLTETETKNIQNQITSKQQSLNKLSSNLEMSAEEKAKERQEIQKQIAELNRKLRMLRMEKREEAKETEKEQEQKTVLRERQTQELSQDEPDKAVSAEKIEEQQKKINISPQNIQKILEVDALLQKERIQQSMNHKKELAGNILETEIKADELYGMDTSVKKEKLSSLIKEESFEQKTKEQPGDSVKKAPVKMIFREDGM